MLALIFGWSFYFIGYFLLIGFLSGEDFEDGDAGDLQLVGK